MREAHRKDTKGAKARKVDDWVELAVATSSSLCILQTSICAFSVFAELCVLCVFAVSLPLLPAASAYRARDAYNGGAETGGVPPEEATHAARHRLSRTSTDRRIHGRGHRQISAGAGRAYLQR